MPFKIVETIEKGQKQLCIVPNQWEFKGELRWPKKRGDVVRFATDENSRPATDWIKLKCSLKRVSILSYELAERELDIMVQNSDTDHTDIENRMEVHENTNCDFNALAEHLIFNHQENASSSSTTTYSREVVLPVAPVSEENNHEIQYQYIENNNIQVLPITDSVQIQNTEILELQTPSVQDTSMEETKIYLKKILDNQTNMAQKIDSVVDNQKKIMLKLASLSTQISVYKRDQNKDTRVVTLSECNPVENEVFAVKPIQSVKALEEMESLLSDKIQKYKLLQQYSIVCSPSEGKGVTCAYKVLDMIFSRDFLCMCSWTGGSRNSDVMKVGLKGYKNVLKFYYELIHSWDKTYSIEDNENFFKTVLKNSLKRKLNKNERASTKRLRTKKAAVVKTNTSSNHPEMENQEANVNQLDTNDKVEIRGNSEDIRNAEIEKDEEEESLC